MKKREYYLLSDVGQIFVRNKKIDKYIEQLNCEKKLIQNNEQFIRTLGKYDALIDALGKKHKQIIENLLTTKHQIEEFASEPICNEVDYLNGYVEGLEFVLRQDREIFDSSKHSFVFFVYSVNEELLCKYELSLGTSSFMKEFNEEGHLKYYISSEADSICKKIREFDKNTEYAICVIYSKNSMPSKEIMGKFSVEANNNIFFVSDRDMLKHSAEDIVKKIFSSTIL